MYIIPITKLEPHQIFVFGSNTSGIHGAGAARQAARDFGAIRYQNEGLQGQSYAIPTVNYLYGDLVQTSEAELDEAIARFLAFAEAHPKLEFLMTKVGCGLAGFTEEFIREKFAAAPNNVVRPEGW